MCVRGAIAGLKTGSRWLVIRAFLIFIQKWLFTHTV
jgi:hypothetical protein